MLVAMSTPSDGHRSIELTQIGPGRFKATNDRGGETFMGGGGDDPDFTPVELLLAAIAGCTAANVEPVTSRRSPSTRFSITASGEKVRDEEGSRLSDLTLRLDIAFPEGPDGDAAREILPRTVQRTLERLCTVSRTVERGTPIALAED
jgi:putative redox protein